MCKPLAGNPARGSVRRMAPRDGFDALLECGILAHGFLRLRCGDCGHDKLVAFSCKRRGLCPSCGAEDRQALEQRCRCITRPALANERVQTNAAGQVVLKLKTPWRDGHSVRLSWAKLLQRVFDPGFPGSVQAAQESGFTRRRSP